MKPFVRIAQRHLMPRFVVSAYYYFRFGAMVSTQARVQISGRIVFGRGTVVKPFAVIQTNEGRIFFGENCAVSSFSHVSASDRDVIVGNNVRMGPGVIIVGVTRNFMARDVPVVDQGYASKGIRIGHDVFVGAGAVILDGCVIGDGAVIGAASLVTRDVSPYQIVAGVPARPMGERRQGVPSDS